MQAMRWYRSLAILLLGGIGRFRGMRAVRMRLGDDRRPGLDGPTMIGAQLGPFTVVRALGDGSGSTYLAEHPLLKIRRAVKIVIPRMTQHSLTVGRFVHAARLSHRNLVQVHDVGSLPSGAWFLVLD